MSKALTKAQTDLDTLRAELEAWISSQPPAPAKPARKPAVKRTRAQLLAAATALPVVLPPAPVEVPQDVDTSWLDLLSPAPVPAPVEAPHAIEAPHAPEPESVPAPLYIDGTHLVRIELEAPHILDFPEPQPVPVRRTLRQAFRDGYNNYGN